MNTDYATILENAGADEFAAEGTQGHALYQLQRRFAELVEADAEFDEAHSRHYQALHYAQRDAEFEARFAGLTERLIAARERRNAALAAVRGGAK